MLQTMYSNITEPRTNINHKLSGYLYRSQRLHDDIVNIIHELFIHFLSSGGLNIEFKTLKSPFATMLIIVLV